jgi:hypothetical protein
MLKHTFYALLAACFVTGTLLAAKDPFVGSWKLNLAKSKVTGEQVKIKDLGGNKYTIDFGDTSDTQVADGTDQPIHFGRTRSITKQGPNVWKVVTKQGGHVISTGVWTLSQDGKTMDIEITGKRPDGSAFHNHVASRRIAGTKGFPGTWQSTQLKISSPLAWEIKPYEGDGLSFITPAEHEHQDMKFDGKDYPDVGPNVPAGSASSGRRVDQRTLETTDKIKGQLMDTVRYKVSEDEKTLTLTVHEKGQPTPLIIVYERE